MGRAYSQTIFSRTSDIDLSSKTRVPLVEGRPPAISHAFCSRASQPQPHGPGTQRRY